MNKMFIEFLGDISCSQILVGLQYRSLVVDVFWEYCVQFQFICLLRFWNYVKLDSGFMYCAFIRNAILHGDCTSCNQSFLR